MTEKDEKPKGPDFSADEFVPEIESTKTGKKTKVVEATNADGYTSRVLVPDDTHPQDYDKGIPIDVDWRFLTDELGMSAALVNTFAQRMHRQGFYTLDDMHRAGAHQAVNDALRYTFQVHTRDIVNRVRSS